MQASHPVRIVVALAAAVAIGEAALLPNLSRAAQDPVQEQESSAGPAAASASISLFDGQSLTGWRGEEGLWHVEDGAIVGQTSAENPLKANSFLVCERELPDDFELHLQYRILAGNSGVQIRSEEVEPFRIRGYQADIDSGPQWTGIIYEERGRGILCQRGQSVAIAADGTRSETSGAGLDDGDFVARVINREWHQYVIRARGPEITLTIDGTVTAHLTDEQDGAARPGGLLALQLHVGAPMRVEFRDLRIEPLSGAEHADR